MQICKDSVVTLSYTLTDADGTLLEQSDPSISYLHGGYDGIFPIVEEALEGQEVGYECTITMSPDEAFGEYDESLQRMEPRHLFPQHVKVGMQFEGQPEGADEDETVLYTVTEVTEDKVMVDGNHPLVGKTLTINCKVEGVRVASEEELTHGHVHGEHGHHH
ncbi:MAG: peptidylprolyl isomerase [Ferrovum sp. 37-45-19]|uniref:FKBP-type peptidyl-prolyl cis-trans isomerase n=1 Tax=Ferrovum sp. JA12 TaxID=1356299 RepID=UPI0007029E90|nr:peptidylprolyl isomerase [Ferrovum sp. JA12]OYV80056.1 MAG: peptidylprolyl isomerase [Ferrovum sp. 21-44-67]OYV93623.1 MAG: peptidylprolyl isomerase [Ferrovum sp. 37-45-19]OZB33483.1 MAG: peptidylprolyl isomerase [Ferrovum sp. 34-44-207]HQT81933.1 peptidylprolyl isomerase [Ferrovaceae bacterium]KRH78027.1 FKBP-type peptidyl-prolyl cis-trans isomerase SlyD [Ferrovum sp. JA12]